MKPFTGLTKWVLKYGNGLLSGSDNLNKKLSNVLQARIKYQLSSISYMPPYRIDFHKLSVNIKKAQLKSL